MVHNSSCFLSISHCNDRYFPSSSFILNKMFIIQGLENMPESDCGKSLVLGLRAFILIRHLLVSKNYSFRFLHGIQ